MINLLSGPLPPNYFRERISRGQTRQSRLLAADRKRLVDEFLHPGPDDHLEVGRGLQPPRVVLRDAGVLALVLPLQLERGQRARRLVQLPTFGGLWRCMSSREIMYVKKVS